MKNTLLKKSLNRIFQEIYAKNFKIEGKIIEFGAFKGSSKNFINFMNVSENSSIVFCDKISKNNNLSQVEDLEKKLSFDENFSDVVLIFNVLEHIFDTDNAINEINRCLKKNGKIIGSVPFIHRIHNAPGDFNRYTPQFLKKILEKNNFINIQIISHGFGPVTACYAIIFDFMKIIPLINNIFLTISILIDKFINLFVKSDLSMIYPITISFSGDKK